MKHFKIHQSQEDYEEYIDIKEADEIGYPRVDWIEGNERCTYLESKPPRNYSQDYLTIEALGSGEVCFNVWKSMGTDMITSISYSIDNGDTWTTTNNTNNKSENLQISVNVEEGDKVLWKGIATQTGYYDQDEYDEALGSFFSSDCEFNAYGNVMSLLYGDDFIGQNSLNNTEYIFTHLFYDFDGENDCQIVSAVNLILPSTTLTEKCYSAMFSHCSSLTTPPRLPATTLAERCYYEMFSSCTSLTTAPTLNATTLVNNCYFFMFKGCTSLATAPALPATTLANYCYSDMFRNCSNLSYIKAMFTSTPSSIYTNNWVSGVAATGTFVKNSAATWNVTGANGVPTRWTVQTASA